MAEEKKESSSEELKEKISFLTDEKVRVTVLMCKQISLKGSELDLTFYTAGF